jgi:hypothetical protein
MDEACALSRVRVFGKTVSMSNSRPRVFLSTVFDPGMHEPLRAAFPDRIWDPRIQVKADPGRTIEDVCRELIRNSRLFVGIFDERGGVMPFEEGIEPVTVLEIELLQALFQRLPTYLFILPGFERNRRLFGLVALAQREGLAVVRTCPEGVVDARDPRRRQLTAVGVSIIGRVIRDPFSQRLRRAMRGLASSLVPFHRLDVCLLDCGMEAIRDPFDPDQVQRQLDKGRSQADHAARLAYLWPALRRLASVPYADPDSAPYYDAWEQLAGAWDHSAAWYGLHSDSPISKLAAVNTLLWLRRSGSKTANPDFARGARASAYYSMARRLWLPWQRRSMFREALHEIEVMLAAGPSDPAGALAIRGSVHLRLWHVSKALADYEAAVAIRIERGDSASSRGEAWAELGWGYLWGLRFRDAKRALRTGTALMREDFRRDPALRVEFLIRALMKHSMAFAIMLDFREAKVAAREGCRLAHQRMAQDQLRGVRGWLCRVWGLD